MCVCVCEPTLLFLCCGALEPFSMDMLSKSCQRLFEYFFLLVLRKTFPVCRSDSYLQRVGGQQNLITLLVLEKNVMGWEKPFISPCLHFPSFSPLRDRRHLVRGVTQNLVFSSRVAGVIHVIHCEMHLWWQYHRPSNTVIVVGQIEADTHTNTSHAKRRDCSRTDRSDMTANLGARELIDRLF